MNKKVPIMPSLEVWIERLPQAVLDSAKGPVKYLREMPISNTSIQCPVKWKSLVKTEVVTRDVAKKATPSLQVILERIPNNLMKSLLAEKKISVASKKRKVGRPRKIKKGQFKNQPPMFDFISV